jgi:hypothetical protein
MPYCVCDVTCGILYLGTLPGFKLIGPGLEELVVGSWFKSKVLSELSILYYQSCLSYNPRETAFVAS